MSDSEMSPASNASGVHRLAMRSPPYVAVVGSGVDVRIHVEDEDDAEIVRLAIQMAERRRSAPRGKENEQRV